MTAITRPFRRLFGRTEPIAATEPAPAPAVRGGAARGRHRHPGDRPAVRVPAGRARAGGPVAARARVAGPGRASRRRRGPRRPAGHPGRADRDAQPRARACRSRTTRPTTAGCSATLAAQAAPAIRVAQLVQEQAAEAAERERYEQELKVAQLIQQQFLPRELPKLPRVADRRLLRARPRRRRRLLRLHRPRRGPDRRRRRRRHRQGRPRRAGHGADALDHARRGAAADRARPGPGARQRAAGARDAGADVRHLPVRRPRARDGPVRVRERGPQPALRAHGGRRHRAAGHRAARSA